MPEYGEVRLMTEFADRVLESRSVLSIEQSPISKVKFELPDNIPYPLMAFIKSRGKESVIELLYLNSTGDSLKLRINYGMSGSWKHSETRWQKHAMFSFGLDDGTFLEFVDARRFGSIKVIKSGKIWSENRGPDPVKEYEIFRSIIMSHRYHRDFRKPLCEILLNQKWFNGVGNYLRSTIIFESGLNPFAPIKDLTYHQLISIIHLVKLWCKKTYDVGGVSLSTWKNPDEKSTLLVDLIFYKKGLCCKDMTGRTFWFDEKWASSCPYPYAKTPKQL